MAKRLLLLSNSTNFGEAYLEHARAHISDFLGDDSVRVLFVPYAGVTVSWDEYAHKVGEVFEDLGYGFDSIHNCDDAVSAVESAGAIAIGGGNTFHLLKTMYDKGIVEPIRARAQAGCPLMGWSAGSNVACPTIRTTNDMPIVEPPTFDALNLVSFQINPHYTDARLPNHGGETRADRIAEFLEANPGKVVVGLREGCALRVEGEELALIGSHKMRVFEGGRQPREMSSDDTFDFLMSGA